MFGLAVWNEAVSSYEEYPIVPLLPLTQVCSLPVDELKSGVVPLAELSVEVNVWLPRPHPVFRMWVATVTWLPEPMSRRQIVSAPVTPEPFRLGTWLQSVYVCVKMPARSA